MSSIPPIYSQVYPKARKQLEREAKRRQREIERKTKETAKLSELEQARYQVELYESQMDTLLSMHKEEPRHIDWKSFATALAPLEPRPFPYNEMDRRRHSILFCQPLSETAIEEARLKDNARYEQAIQQYKEAVDSLGRYKNLAKGILNGDIKSYTDALLEINPFRELSELGSSIHFAFHSAYLASCTLSVKGEYVIPAEIKALTSAGKLTSRKMARSRFNEIY